eukprot:GFKZ01010672.1.p1 GENE.GFKZ01010672.1~~GFKZ01010672.1.p1  ORF type:complete len:498 (-),score=55.72 GFKZ01010672.1:1301-2794(-)
MMLSDVTTPRTFIQAFFETGSAESLPALIFTVLLVFAVKTIFQSARWNSLNHIPTPPLRVWQRYTVGHNVMQLMFGGDARQAAEKFNAWRTRFGPIYVVRSLFGGATVMIMSEGGLRAINITNVRRFHKTQMLRDSLGSLVGLEGILLAEGERHRALRGTMSGVFRHDQLMKVIDVFTREGRIVADKLGEMENGGDLLRVVREGTFAVIIEGSFGSGVMKQSEIEELREAYLESFLEPMGHVIRRSLCQSLLWWLPKRWFGWREDLRRVIRNKVKEVCGRDRVGGLVGMMESLERTEMEDTVLSFLAAGQATTSMAVCWVLYVLGEAAEWQDKVWEEVKAWGHRGAQGKEVEGLKVLGRVVKEVLRLYPPVMYTARKVVQEVELDGFRLGVGTVVRVPVLAVQRCPQIWGSDVGTFDPDRWLKKEVLTKARTYWMPFSHGPRNCIGQRFAVFQIQIFVALILLKHRVLVKPEEDGRPGLFGVFGTPKNMKVYFEPRQ